MTSQSPHDRLNRSSNDILEATSFLFGSNAPYIESLYTQFLAHPDSVDPSWAAFFAELGQPALTPAQTGGGPSWAPRRPEAWHGFEYRFLESPRPPAPRRAP